MTPSPTYFPSFSTVIGLLPELAATDSADLDRKESILTHLPSHMCVKYSRGCIVWKRKFKYAEKKLGTETSCRRLLNILF